MLRTKRYLSLATLMACAAVALAATPAGTKLADEANAKTTQFRLSAPATVSYGAGSAWTEKTLDVGSYVCHPATFGLSGTVADPRKQCKLTLKGGGVYVPPVTAAPLTMLTGQSGTFTLKVATAVKYGGDGKFVQKPLMAGAHVCTDGYFGDPAPGVPKACYVAPAGDPAPQSMNRAGTTEAPATEVPVVTVPVTAPPASGSIADPDEYRRIAALMGTQAGLDYLYGTAAGKVPTNAYPARRRAS